jgi:hypothetical protein
MNMDLSIAQDQLHQRTDKNAQQNTTVDFPIRPKISSLEDGSRVFVNHLITEVAQPIAYIWTI